MSLSISNCARIELSEVMSEKLVSLLNDEFAGEAVGDYLWE